MGYRVFSTKMGQVVYKYRKISVIIVSPKKVSRSK